MDILHSLHTVVRLVYETLAMLYQSLLIVGALGFAVQAVMGFAHGGGGGHHAHNGGGQTHAGDVPVGNHHTPLVHHTPHTAAAATPAAAGTHHPAHSSTHHNGGEHNSGGMEKVTTSVLTVLSPLMIFSVCLGMGATGLLLQTYLDKPLTALFAIAGGVAFYALITRPMLRLVYGFASKPAENLDGSVAQDAVSMSHFDATGKGMVRVTVDGEVKRLLAHLDREDVANNVAVAPGDRLVIVSVDTQKNTCNVVRL